MTQQTRFAAPAGTKTWFGKTALVAFFLISIIWLSGCATDSTIESRRKENPAAYAALAPDIKTLVDQGRIKAGMTSSAVYLAWGPPAQKLHSGDQNGEYATWVYYGGYFEENRYWVGRRFPHVKYDYEPRTYVRAEVIFVNGVVQRWQTLPQPAY